jgi:hypothetical protein
MLREREERERRERVCVYESIRRYIDKRQYIRLVTI